MKNNKAIGPDADRVEVLKLIKGKWPITQRTFFWAGSDLHSLQSLKNQKPEPAKIFELWLLWAMYSNSAVQSDNQKILAIVKDFYRKLYFSTNLNPNHRTYKHSKFWVERISRIFLHQEKIKSLWTCLRYVKWLKMDNYRPMNLLPHSYKLLTKDITNILSKKLDDYQSHIQTIRMLIEKSSEYNVPLHLAFIAYNISFDSIKLWAIFNAINKARIDSYYKILP